MTEKKKQKRSLRFLLTGIAFALVVLTFTPLILTPGKIEPKFMSMPYTLWTSILITIFLLILSFLVSKLQDTD